MLKNFNSFMGSLNESVDMTQFKTVRELSQSGGKYEKSLANNLERAGWNILDVFNKGDEFVYKFTKLNFNQASHLFEEIGNAIQNTRDKKMYQYWEESGEICIYFKKY